MVNKPSFLRTLACVLLLVAAPAWAALPTLKLADVPAGDLDGKWGDPSTVGDVAFRSALKGGMQMVNVPAWWPADSLRPPADTVYALEVLYKDAASQPVIFYANSGLAQYFRPTEVHRFGGSGDGEWKTAVLPVGGDQIIRLADRRDMTAFGFRANADLPIASITVRLTGDGDEERYNAETRAWVAALQAGKRKATAVKVEPRKFSSDKKLSPVVAFAWPAMVAMGPDAQPTDEQVGAPIKIRMCLNELEGGSFGVYANGEDLSGVSYKVSDLVGPGGKLAADVIARTVEYSLAPGKGGFQWKPMRLWPAYEVDIPAGRSHWFVLNVRTKRGVTKAGLYKGDVTVSCAKGKATLPVEVEVLNVDLPTMEEAGLFMGGCVKGLLPARDFEFAADYNQNGVNLWFSGIRPGVKMVDGKLAFDFEYLDEWMVSARKKGLVGIVYFLGGNPYGYPQTMHLFREMALLDTRGGKTPPTQEQWMAKQAQEANRDKPMPADRELAVEWIRQVAAHARQAGWPEMILTPFDEPPKWVQGPGKKEGYDKPGVIGAGPWIKPYFKDACAAIREADPKTRIYASIHHTNRWKMNEGFVFIPDVDLFCTNAIREDYTAGDQVRAAGHTLWQYSSVGGGRPDAARLTFGLYFAAVDSRGSLCWAYNWGPGFDNSGGGDMYAWQTPFGTIPAPYFEGMREAWDDRRVVEAYKKAFASDAGAMADLDAILKEALKAKVGGGSGVEGYWAAIDAAAKLDTWRGALLDRLAKVGR